MNQQSKDVVKRLAQIRKSKGVKQDEMALVLDMPDDQYQKLERGIGEMTLSQMFRISEILKIQGGSLFNEAENVIYTNVNRN